MQVTTQHTEATSDKTQEEPGPVTNHRAQNLQVLHICTASTLLAAPLASSAQNPQVPSAACNFQSHQAASTSADCRMQWPQSSKKPEWQQFDEDVDQILEGTAKGDVDRRLKTIVTIIVNIAAERFGTLDIKSAPSSQGRTKVA